MSDRTGRLGRAANGTTDDSAWRGRLDRVAPLLIASAGATIAFSGVAAAQTQIAGDICGTGAWNFLIGLSYALMGLSLVTVVSSTFFGAALKSVGWLGRTINEMGNKAIAFGLAGLFLLIISLAIMTIGLNYNPVDIPTDCYIPL